MVHCKMIRRTGPSRSPTPNGGHDQRETAAANGVAASNQLFGAVVLRHDQRPDRPRRRDPEGALRRPSGSCRHRAGLRALRVAALAQRMQRLPSTHAGAARPTSPPFGLSIAQGLALANGADISAVNATSRWRSPVRVVPVLGRSSGHARFRIGRREVPRDRRAVQRLLQAGRTLAPDRATD